MKLARLGEVAAIERDGIAPEKIVAGTPYLGLEHIESGGRIISSEPVANGELASMKFQFGPEHLLYGKLRPYLAKIALPDFAGICSTDILPVKVGPDLDKRYLAYFLRQPRMVDFANSRSSGANLPRLSPKALADFQIPLPPLPEQRQIAAILDQTDALRRKRAEALSRLNALGQAIFYEMFGDPLALGGINVTRLAEIAELINGDRSSNYPSGDDIKDAGIVFLNTTNIKNGELDFSRLRTY
ncbi:restriction endonuclease subunit S [Novosphingobium sp. AAP83]|uniref:restriction endonuclease subunit S n=1 Tax=Novosphingobium sp. AAP83 TaxID=1523425 RepID=UPI0006B93EE1|nr:restriction endonuclease subunit S [Novosphingobium sp. AAP83]